MSDSSEIDFSKYRGMPVDDAVAAIKALGKFEVVVKIPLGSMVTADYRLDRVRVTYDTNTQRCIGADVG